MRELRGRVAVVTGTASGIGRALAVELAREGCRLAISDVNEAGLQETAQMVQALGAEVRHERLDVADRQAVHAHADRVAQQFGGVNLVINNAGVALGATVELMRYEDLEWLMGINFWGVVHGTKAFLPYLQKADEAHLVNISSIFGLIGAPTQSAYNAAKFAVRGFTEALRQELAIEGSRVGVTCVHPGGIKTNIARASRFGATGVFEVMQADRETVGRRFEQLARTTPEQAARAIIEGVRNNRRRVLIGTDARIIDLVQRLFPTGYQRVAEAMTRRRLAAERAARR